MTRPQPHQPVSQQGQQHDPDEDHDGNDEHEEIPRDEHGRQEPQHDDGHGLPQMVYTAEHDYHEDAQGDHLVRVVSPVGVFAEFIGTPGAELMILTPPGHADVPPNGKLPLQAHIKYPDPDHPPQQVTAQADWTSSHKEVATIGNAPGVGNQGMAQAPGSSAPDKGVVTGRKKGTTKITVTFGGLKATKTIAVKDPSSHALTIDTPSGQPEVKQGQKLPLRSTVTLDGGKTQAVTNKTQWVSSDPSVASVSPTGEVTGVKGGSAVITGTYKQGEEKPVMAKLKVTVEAELDGKGGAHTEHGADENKDNNTPETGEGSAGKDKNDTPENTDDANKGSTDNGTPQGSNESGQNPSETPSQGGAQDPSQGGAAEQPSQPTQDPSAGQAPAEGGVQPQYGQ